MQTLHSLAFLISLSLLLCAKAASPDIVDVYGNLVRSGVDYSILPAVPGQGGPVTMGHRPTGRDPCPAYVHQEKHEESLGFPVRFSPVDQEIFINESTDMNIRFNAITYCINSNVWCLSPYDPQEKRFFISTVGEVGDPGQSTVNNWFKIERSGDHYKLRFCPTVCSSCKVMCKDIGIHIDRRGNRLLTMTDKDPFLVMFKRMSK